MKLTPRVVIFLLPLGLVLSAAASAAPLLIRHDAAAGTISVYRVDEPEPILTQNARPDFRPYLHPIVAPDGKGILTEYSPGHHRHQTGLYWGFTRVNGRDYFHHPEGTYWRRVSVKVVTTQPKKGKVDTAVRWQTVYDLLDEKGEAVLTETQGWTMRERPGKSGNEYVLDLEWVGEAKTDVTIGKYDYGGLFLRMPWRKGIRGEVVNTARQRGPRAEGQRSVWVDVGMQVEGREDLAHIAIFDHSRNPGFPQPWRVDKQLGVGPVRARLGDWRIGKGKRAVIRHQLIVYTGELDDVALTKKWGQFSGQGGTGVLWGLAQREGRAADFLTPAEAVEKMTLQKGFQVNVFASEPMITQPMAFCWDDRGRMWIAENRDYESRGRGFSGSGDSRILILEDTDRDGVADSRKVFLEGVPFPAAIAVGFDGLWLGAPPNLLFVPDRDGDDVADKDDIEVRLTGWGIRDRHETLNSFHWGPDGWLYGCQGFATPSRVGKPRGKGKLYKHREPFPRRAEIEGNAVDINGGVWRYHPTKDRFEVVAHGFSNPWGIDYDAKGQLFISACVIPHLWHVIPGGIYHRQGGRHFNAHVYSDIRTITDHRHRSAHGGARVYLSDAFPERYHGRLFMANIHEHAVLTDVLEPKGSGFVGRHGDDFLLANNAQWIGFSMEIGPEGGVYALDWHDADICGKAVLQKETGRVFRVTPTVSRAKSWEGRYGNLAKLDDAALVELQRSPSAWHARRARVILQGRAAKGAVGAPARQATRDLIKAPIDPDIRLRALWTLHVSGGATEAELLGLLDDADPHLRAWAIQLLCEDNEPSAAALERFARLARSDASAVVRLYLAAALQRMPNASRWPIAMELVAHADDADDHNIPKMLWFAMEPLVPGDPRRSLELAARSRLPLIARHIGRRLTHADKLETLIAAIGTSPGAREDLLRGMQDGLRGRRNVRAPGNWGAIFTELRDSKSANTRELVIELAQQLGDKGAGQELLGVLSDGNATLEARQSALRSLASQKFAGLLPKLTSLLDDKSLRRGAIRAAAAFEDERLASVLLERYPGFDTDEKLDIVHTLATRPSYGWRLTQAIKSNRVPRRDVPAYVARQLRRVVGSGFVEIWGPIDALSDDKKAALAKYRALLTAEALAKADPRRGRVLFKRTCNACHKIYGEGGLIGPDITGANRGDLNYLLGNVLTPSEVIQDDYKMTLVLTDEGRLYSGILAGENKRQLTLRVANQEEPAVIAKSSIQSREIAPVSMMPDGILSTLTDAEVVDLVRYLQTTKQVPLPQ